MINNTVNLGSGKLCLGRARPIINLFACPEILTPVKTNHLKSIQVRHTISI
jgi:hypothetical protein